MEDSIDSLIHIQDTAPSPDSTNTDPNNQILLSPKRVLKRANNLIVKATELDKEGRKWGVYESPLHAYERDFKTVLAEFGIPSLRTFLAEKARSNGGVRVIDFMGAGQALRDIPNLDFGIAVTLVDRRNEEIRRSDEQKNIMVIEGNLLTKETWDKISEALKKRGGGLADVVMCRGLAGIDTIPREFWASLFGRAYKLTDNHGLLITEAREIPGLSSWVEKVHQTGINIKQSYDMLGILKDKGAPDMLPGASIIGVQETVL